jgi:hypothetical protein
MVNTLLEKHIIKVGRKRREMIEKGVKKKFGYNHSCLCEESSDSRYRACTHYFNSNGGDGLVVDYKVELDGVEIIKASLEFVNFRSQNSEYFSIYGYGKKWKKFKIPGKNSYPSDFKSALNIRRNKELFMLDPLKIIEICEIQTGVNMVFSDGLSTQKPLPYVC